MRRGLLFLAIWFFVHALLAAGLESRETFTWGTNAVILPAPCRTAPSPDELLTNKLISVAFDRFYRLGGENAPVAPTECRIAYNNENLFVVFRCSEKDMAFPAVDHNVDWHAFLQSPSEQDAAFPDKVDFFITPDFIKPKLYHFALTMDGHAFGATRGASLEAVTTEDATLTSSNNMKIASFEGKAIKRTNGWIAFMRIPWATVGGKPSSSFGFLPVRTRWRDSEVISPVAMDFPDRSPIDIFIEANFPEKMAQKKVGPSSSCLYEMPSGTLRWQRPAILTYPSADTISQIWRMEQSLGSQTTPANLEERIYLTQRWTDLLKLEGFSFLPTSGSIVQEDLSVYLARRHVNRALAQNDKIEACRVLDDYLARLDSISRKWFADGSPGDIAHDQWKEISTCSGIEQHDGVVYLHCAAGDHPIDLHIALPKDGGVRLYTDAEGYFKPAGVLPLTFSSEDGRHLITAPNGSKISVEEKPLSISICDPTGKAVMRIAGTNLSFRFDAKGKVLAVDYHNHLDGNEVIYGFGEKFDRFNQNGNILTLWGIDDFAGTIVGLRNASYKPVPVFHSSKGYTVFDNSSYRLRADVGSTHSSDLRLTQAGPIFDYYFWTGTPERALESYTALTGKPFLPPKWAFEPWMGRTGRGWNNTPAHNPVTEEERVIKRFKELDIPHSALYAEGPSAETPALYDFLKPRGIKAMSWYYSAISGSTQAKLMSNKEPSALAVLDTGEGSSRSKEIDYVDFTNPNALEVCRRWWNLRLSLGVAGSMVDFGDRVPETAVFHNGKSGAEMHNFYSYDYQRTYNEVFREKRGDDFILFGRAAAPGTQRWAGQFAGDHRANFVGLQATLNGAMNLCACGFSTWGSDLGGFLGWPEPAVYMRWTEFSCFSGLMRCHGRTPREPWEYGAPALANYKHYAWVRENLLDYIYNTAVATHETGIPIMRSMPVAFPHEPALAGVSDQYMFGDDLLVAPVTTEENRREISFPAGHWTSLWDGKIVNGPAKVRVDAPLDRIPVYLHEGSLFPVRLNPDLEFGHSFSASNVVSLVVTPPKTSETAKWINSKNEPAFATIHATSTGFAMTLENLSEASYLLVYGAPVATVKVDGATLQTLNTAELGSRPGWSQDSAINRIDIHLPSNSSGDKTRKIEVELELRIANR